MEIDQWSLPKRKEYIKKLQESKASSNYDLNFQGEVRPYPVYVVDIGFPCYRLTNGRTKAAQLEYIKRNSLPDDYFLRDPDSEPALKAQDSILHDMVHDAGLYTLFKRRKQDQPLILDNDGYIINGNRRICAMRMLFETDEVKYSHFKNVKVIFLPQCTPRDIKELEGMLQVQPDIRADYSWVAEAMLYRDLMGEGWSENQIADLYEKKQKDIKELIAMLRDAETYLENRGKTDLYSNVVKMEFAFRQLHKSRVKCGDNVTRKQLITSISYLMIDNQGTAEGRLYENIPDAFKYLDKIKANIEKEFSIDGPEIETGTDGFEILGGASNGEDPVIGLLEDTDQRGKISTIIIDTIEETKEEEKEKKDATFCYRQVFQAQGKLESALSALDMNAEITGIEELLKNIDTVIVEIREWLSNANDQD